MKRTHHFTVESNVLTVRAHSSVNNTVFRAGKGFFIGFLLIVLGMAVPVVNAQNISRTGYFMDNSTHKHLMNPALTPVRGYFSLPAVGEFSLGLESNMQFTNFIYPPNTGDTELMTFLHPDVPAEDFLSQLSLNNYLRTDVRTSLISMGFYTGASFWTFDVAARVNLSLNLPYDLFAFLKEGMASPEGNLYHLGDLSVSSSVFAEASLGYSRNIMNNLRIGGKLKFLAGGAYVRAYLETMDVNMTPEEWSVTSDGRLEAFGKGLTLLTDEDGSINDFDFGTPGLGGMGAAIDLGVSYSPLPNLDLSLAIIDLGGIKWDKENINRGAASGSVTFSGVEEFSADSAGQSAASDQLEVIKDDLLKMADFKKTDVTEDVIQRLFPTVNAGLEYSMLNNKVSLGVLYSNRFMLDDRYSELTGSLNLRPFRWFNLSGSYSFIHGKKETFGFALGFVPFLFNLYLACDYTFFNVSPQFIPLNTMTTNFQLGISIPLGRGKVPPKHI